MMQREELERESRQLRERERSLRCMAQSVHCAYRTEAERELERVRAAISLTYVQLRQLGPHPMDQRFR